MLEASHITTFEFLPSFVFRLQYFKSLYFRKQRRANAIDATLFDLDMYHPPHLFLILLAALCIRVCFATTTEKTTVPSRSDKASSAHAWPTSLDIEIDVLKIGGVSLPWTESSLQNLDVGARNFGNIDMTRVEGLDQARAAAAEVGDQQGS